MTDKQAHGRRKHQSGQANRPGGKCMRGDVVYRSKREAEAASPNGRARHCGNCKHWHAA